MGRAAAAGDPGQRGARGLAAGLAGRQALARDRELLRASRGRRAPRAASGGAIREPVDEAQARPGRVDRADLVVDQAVRGPSSRATSSVRSVAMPEARFGQAIQSPPPGNTVAARRSKRRSSSRARVKKATMTSRGATARRFMTTPSGSSPSRRSNPGGAPGKATVLPSLIPSLRGSGVPEYPATRSPYALRCGRRRKRDPLRRGLARNAGLCGRRHRGRQGPRGRGQLPRAHPRRDRDRDDRGRICASPTRRRSAARRSAA